MNLVLKPPLSYQTPVRKGGVYAGFCYWRTLRLRIIIRSGPKCLGSADEGGRGRGLPGPVGAGFAPGTAGEVSHFSVTTSAESQQRPDFKGQTRIRSQNRTFCECVLGPASKVRSDRTALRVRNQFPEVTDKAKL